MKKTTIKLLSVLTLGAALAYIPVASAEVIYQDNFNRTGDLNGSTPTVGGNTWSSANWSTDGSAAKPDAAGYMAILPFNPVQGNIYTLSASMNPTSPADSSSWFALGFTNRNATDNWFGGDQNSASIFARVSNNEYPDFYAPGPGLSGIANLGNYTDGVAHVYSITLDTTAGNSANWTVSYSVDGTQVIAPTALGYNPTINYVGFGSGDATGGTISNFSLTCTPIDSVKVIYQDNFNRTGDLNGSMPTLGAMSWSSSNWSTDGSAAKPAANGFMAILPFTPVQGNIYTLSASMNPTQPAGGSNWFALGFTNRNATDNWLGGAQNSASIFARVSNNAYPDFYAQGPGTGGIGNLGSYTDGVAHLYSITLDTTDLDPANWTASYSVDGTQVIAPTALGYNPTINYVGFGADASAGTIDNFSLTYTTAAPAQVIYQDNFNRTGDLNGSTPTVGGNTWSSGDWSTDGSAAKPDAAGYMAILPFTPVQGNIYTLSASMNPIGVPDPSDWFVLGFTGRNATDNWFVGDQYSASAGARGSNSVHPDFYYNGPGLSRNLGNFTDGVAHVYSITLDTTAGNPANWTVAYSVDYTQVVAPTALGNAPTINYVGFGNAATGGAIDNFSLTVVAVPGSSPYARWATDNAGGQAANLDWDNDGVTNGVEFFMNAVPGFTANPGLVGNTVTWPNGGNIPSSGYGTQFVVQTSNDLVTWDEVTEGDLDQNGTNTASSLSYTLDPVNNPGKQFVRLKVTPN